MGGQVGGLWTFTTGGAYFIYARALIPGGAGRV